MIFWNLYGDYDTTEHSIEFKNVRSINPIQIIRIQEIEEDGLKYTRFYTNANSSGAYYYPGTIEEFNQVVEKEQQEFEEKHPFFDCILCCPKLDESTFMFTSVGRSETEDGNTDFLLEQPKTLTINLDELQKTMCKHEVEVIL